MASCDARVAQPLETRATLQAQSEMDKFRNTYKSTSSGRAICEVPDSGLSRDSNGDSGDFKQWDVNRDPDTVNGRVVTTHRI